MSNYSLFDYLDGPRPVVVIDDPRTPEMIEADKEIDAMDEFEDIEPEPDAYVVRPSPAPTQSLYAEKYEIVKQRHARGESLFSPLDRWHDRALQAGSYEPEAEADTDDD